GAMSGRRGGFITLGLAAQARLPLTQRLAAELGGYVGAGGGRGGLALTGGGLFLRSNLGLFWDTGAWGRIGAGASYVAAPYGSIHSTQPYIAYQYAFNSWSADGWLPPADSPGIDSYVNPTEEEFALVYRHDLIPSGVRTSGGAPQHRTLKLMGIEWHRYLSDHFYLSAETEGAMGGQSNGYMQILLGGGVRLHLTDSTAVKLTLAAGPAGGGDVATGGGIIVDGSLGLQQYFNEKLYVEADGGYTKAVHGSFRAYSISGKLGYRFGTPDTPDDRLGEDDLAPFPRRHLRWRITHQTYKGADPLWRKSYADRSIDLLGFQGDYFLNNHFYLTGEAMAAYHGKAGAYMTGLFGAGVQLSAGSFPLFAYAEGLAGAAGGGGVDVSGGLVWQANAGLGCRLPYHYSLMAGYGRMQSIKGHFKADVLSLSLAHRFTLFAM
ncbi:MAG TPA: hypothetical protein VNH42_07370, partial [Mariprofundaceae bacterium]|nr:hypothetical protein [Mariprofundaceae bacterium]